MPDALRTADAANAARLVAMGLRPRQLPARDERVRRARPAVSAGPIVRGPGRSGRLRLGLGVLAVTRQTGIVLAAMSESVFEMKIDDYVRRTALRDRQIEKILHGLIHLAVAALSFPRADDLADDTYVGRVSVDQVDQVVREACRSLDEKVSAADVNTDPLQEAPGLEQVWRAYARRPSASATKDGRIGSDSTRGMISKALKFLAEQGFVHQVNEEGGGTYRTTPRYQIQVRELAAERAFDELVALGVIEPGTPGGSIQSTRPEREALDV